MPKVFGLILALVFAFAFAQPTIDGAINADEYENSFTHDDSSTTLHWTIVDDVIYMGIEADSRGWLGFGWMHTQENRKLGADQLIFIYENDEGTVLDMFQDTARREPSPDEDLGGSNSIEDYAITRDGTSWVIEFSRPLDTEQETDVDIVPGEPMILLIAHATTMNIGREHARNSRWYVEDFEF
jgi:hypothetical protein